MRDWSVWLDLVLLARTVRALFVDKGAYWSPSIGDHALRCAFSLRRFALLLTHISLTVQRPTLKFCASVHDAMACMGQYHRKSL